MKTQNTSFLISASLVALWFTLAFPAAAAVWDGPKQYVLLSTSDAFDGSTRKGKAQPNPYQIVHDTYGSFEGKSVALGVSPMFRVFQKDMSLLAIELKNHLDQSQQYKVPIFICLSSFVFNNARPDLWNWWDKNAAGYNPENIHNVEWTNWTSDSAVKIGWLNWGSQMRLPPMPNLMSSVFQREVKIAFTTLGSIVKEWHDKLPANEKWLLVGFRSTDEVAIGINNWHYPNGNAYLNLDSGNDPKTGLKPLELPSRGVQTIGYAAVKTAGIKSSGAITIEDLHEVCRRHCEYCSKVLFDLGFPREKIYSSSFGKTVAECKTCLTKFSCPSWSFYHKEATHPTEFTAALEALKSSDTPCWAMAEWGVGKNSKKETYRNGLSTSLAMPHCKFIRLTGEWFKAPAQAMKPEVMPVLKSLTQ